jgi:type III secretion system YscD/HrpQ family protein
MNAKLIAEEGMLKGLVLPLEGGDEWVIGRDPESCQLLLEDPSASRKHLLCRKTEQGITLENLSSTNPVEVNDEVLSGERLLHEGDMIRIGSGMYRFLLEPTGDNPLREEQAQAVLQKLPEEENEDSILELTPEEADKETGAEVHFEVLEQGRWLLKVIGGPNNGAEFSMQPGSTYIIGTDPASCDIVFHDTSVSRQHARLSIKEDDSIFIEDLKSRNGTLLDGEVIADKVQVNPNTIVTMGTTSFVIYDRDGSMHTIISPLLPSIVKVLQKQSSDKEADSLPEDMAGKEPLPIHVPEKSTAHLLFIAIVTGMFVLVALGTATLFKSQPIVVKEEINPDKALGEVFTSNAYPSLKYSFNKANGRLVIFGHLLTSQDKTQLIYALQALPMIKSIDDTGIIIDEYVWIETNQVLSKNPNWKTVTLQSPSPGQFILTGNLTTRKQADQLYEYITANFPYLDRLSKQVVVEEDVLSDVKSSLERAGIYNSQVNFKNGELSISGGIPSGKQEVYQKLTEEFKAIPGVRFVKSQVSSLAESQSMVNISDRYEVSGFSQIGKTINVVVNGRIVAKGDVLDGMVITEIAPGTVYLEKDGVKYRIDFSK